MRSPRLLKVPKIKAEKQTSDSFEQVVYRLIAVAIIGAAYLVGLVAYTIIRLIIAVVRHQISRSRSRKVLV